MCKRVELCLLDNIETAIAHRDGCLLFGRTYGQGFTLQLSFPSAATAAAGDGNSVSNSNGTTTWLLQAGTQGTAPHLKCVKNRCAVNMLVPCHTGLDAEFTKTSSR